MTAPTPREIPFNYTSADDRQAVSHLLGEEAWRKLEQLRERRVTGRSARLLLRVLGELLVHRRNAYLFEEVVSSPKRRRVFFQRLDADLDLVEKNAGEEELARDVVAEARTAVSAFRREVSDAPGERARLVAALAPVVGAENVLLDPFTLVSHATDATDWRLHLPLAVVTPSEEAQVAPLLATIAKLGLHAIPRGAGTGLTGGAVPLQPRCVVVNTERLNRILGIEERTFALDGGRSARASVMRLEAGVITEAAMEHAAERGLVFATDPTSAWACTIGGNVAENAGGKTAVLWGTCIDNLVSWTMAMPSGATWTVRRDGHPLRKILHDDLVRFTVTDRDGAPGSVVRHIALRGDEIRKRGLWKDITNKALGGLPGMQKEGTDGVVTSAEFVLYQQYEASRTLCLEFFGPDLDEASEVILALARAFPNEGKEVLQALEHFDDQYVQAIRYEVKAPRAETPKAVLLVDVVGHSDAEAERGVARLREILDRHPNTFCVVAKDKAEAKRFWADRKKLGAIAKRTNAFKLNEDVVLPLEALAEFARFCDRLNVEEERANQARAIDRLEAFLAAVPPPTEDGEWLGSRLAQARARCDAARAALAAADDAGNRAHVALHALVRDLRELLRTYPQVVEGALAAVEHVRSRRLVIATHMHAGDGNVHVNIPVMSNDREMMRHAEELVDRVMIEVDRLGGVCSGEHGIGVTKLKYLDPARKAELAAYRAEVDPRGVMNPGKLEDVALLDRIFTPSFNLLELEARILQHGQLEELAARIATCIRCGKCKPDCCVFHPARGMFYHPRNKNLAIGALVEALLYDAQRERSAGFELLSHLEDLADHCTLCHKCAKPCPVSIDTAEVSILERRILAARGYKRTALTTGATLRYLESTSPAANAAFRAGVVRLGGALQRGLAKALGPQQPASTSSRGPLALLRSPVPAADPETLRDALPDCEPDQALVLEPDGEAKATVFYFPGCGSERLFSSVSRAAIHLLLETGTRVVLPPPFLCCGYPHHANAKEEAQSRISLRDGIVFSQIREMFRYLDFDAVVVTCGTCREALGAMEAGEIFGCEVQDVSRFALARGLQVEQSGDFLWHTPCHDSLDGKGPEVLAKLGAGRAERVPHCCSEAGTLALSRPDITDAMLHRKRAALDEALHERPGAQVMLTNCPSCMQGLGRHAALPVEVRHVAVQLAEAASGRHWEEAFRARARKATAVRF